MAGDDFLVLTLDGSLVPWDKLEIDKYEDKPGEFAPLLKQLKGMTLAVSVGVRKGYLLVALGSSAGHLAQFAGPGPKLADRPEFKPLAKHAGQPVLALSYTSAKLLEPLATKPEDVAVWVELARAGLEKADLSEELTKAIQKDVDDLAHSYWRDVRKPGATTTFTFRTPRGWETFGRDYTAAGTEAAAAARPLTLLNHVGGSPLMAAIGRSSTTVEDYRAMVRWLAAFGGHVEQALIEKVPPAEEGVKMFRTQFVPLLKELSDVTEKLWLPALADGQEALVLDAKWASRKWHAAMPEPEKPLPLLELGVVLGVSDAAKLEEALESYRTGVNRMIAKVRELAPPGTVPEFEIPKPQVETKGGSTFAHYPIPEQLGIDPRFQPTAHTRPRWRC